MVQRRYIPLAVLATAVLAAGCGSDDGDSGAASAAADAIATTATTPDAATTTDTAAATVTSSSTTAHAKRSKRHAKAAGSTKDDDAASTDDTSSSSSSSSSSSASHRTAKKRAATHRKRKRSTPSSTKTTKTAAAPAPADPGLGPLPTGSFDCDTTGFLKGGGFTATMPSTTQLTISSLGNGVQQQSRDLRDRDGNGPTTRVVLVYDAAGVHLRTLQLSGKLSVAKDDRTLDASGDPLFLSAHPQAGEQHSFGISGSGVNGQVDVRVTGSDTVAGVASWLLDITVTYAGEISGSTRQEQAIAKSNGFPVREHAVTDLKLKAGASHSEYTVTSRRVPGGG